MNLPRSAWLAAILLSSALTACGGDEDTASGASSLSTQQLASAQADAKKTPDDKLHCAPY